MLQCTALTRLPLSEVLTALVTMPYGPDAPPDDFTLDHYVLCELGEHRADIDHAALLCPAENPDRPALWFFWSGTDTDRTHRITTAPWCPAVLRHLRTDAALPCSLFTGHPTGHSWDITDPLADLIAGAAGADTDTDTDTDTDASDDPRKRHRP
ncbi:hypothetical protein STAN_2022 [Streptomyces sp. CBMAI 2042]|uniref:hypothetical protein n=1 Tax=Streptomyces sp. CBMAI 2042 TaxID=2305222 RepID=UPI000F26D7C5|nr:hypothetical protein [Streptomyces sp. CBMAI 2042]RLV66501.1 hypothetical protein STAN_2022 [Streptomyces sp. CBMAI 2042]